MKCVHIYALFLMVVFHTYCGQNQTNVPKENINYDIKDTVTSYGPNTMVRNVKQDRNGNILIAASWGGVFRYDGKSFQNFTTKDGLPHNGGRAIMEDKTGKLWIATGDGPCFYDGKTFTVLKNKDDKAFKNVWSIIEDKKGSIWFGDVDGLWRYDGRTFTKVSQRGLMQ